MERIFFLALAAMTVLGGILVISLRNAVHCALALVFTLVATAGLYLLQGAQFLAAIQVLVYAGAIMVLFIFVIMMLNLNRDEIGETGSRGTRFPAILLSVVLLVEIGAASAALLPRGARAEYAAEAARSLGHSQSVGIYLFTGYAFPFEIASVLLLVAILGAVALTREHGRVDGRAEGRSESSAAGSAGSGSDSGTGGPAGGPAGGPESEGGKP